MRPSAYAAALSLALCVLFVLLLCASHLRWGGWASARRGGISYILLVHKGRLLVLRAPASPDPAGWHFARGRCMGSAGAYGPLGGSLGFEHTGLIDTAIRIPEEVTPADGPGVVAGSSMATGRSVALPMWLVAALASYLPIRWLVVTEKERADRQRRGFPVPPPANAEHATESRAPPPHNPPMQRTGGEGIV